MRTPISFGNNNGLLKLNYNEHLMIKITRKCYQYVDSSQNISIPNYVASLALQHRMDLDTLSTIGTSLPTNVLDRPVVASIPKTPENQFLYPFPQQVCELPHSSTIATPATQGWFRTALQKRFVGTAAAPRKFFDTPCFSNHSLASPTAIYVLRRPFDINSIFNEVFSFSKKITRKNYPELISW